MSAGACVSAISGMQHTASSLLCPQDMGHFFLSGCEKSGLTDVATGLVLLNAWLFQADEGAAHPALPSGVRGLWSLSQTCYRAAVSCHTGRPG